MAGVSLRAVAELLGHKGLRMVMRYAHLSPGGLTPSHVEARQRTPISD
jgi:site-specific recombinase XerD